MPEVICMGEVLVDLIEEPRFGDDSTSFDVHFGSAPANVAIHLARLGTEVSLFASVGRDEFGEFLVAELEASKVHVHGVQIVDERKTSLAFIRLGEGQEPKFDFYRAGGVDCVFVLGEGERRELEQTAILHVGSFSLSQEPFASVQA